MYSLYGMLWRRLQLTSTIVVARMVQPFQQWSILCIQIQLLQFLPPVAQGSQMPLQPLGAPVRMGPSSFFCPQLRGKTSMTQRKYKSSLQEMFNFSPGTLCSFHSVRAWLYVSAPTLRNSGRCCIIFSQAVQVLWVSSLHQRFKSLSLHHWSGLKRRMELPQSPVTRRSTTGLTLFKP